MDKLVKIGKSSVSVKEYHGQRVVTFKEIDECHGRPEGTAGRNFRINRKHLVEGTDFFKISPDEFRRTIGKMDKRQQNDITLVTESGYLMLVKSFTDDLAWDVQRQLVNIYFRVQKTDAPIDPAFLAAQSQLIEAQAEIIRLMRTSPNTPKQSPIRPGASDMKFRGMMQVRPHQTGKRCHISIPGSYYQRLLEICKETGMSITGVATSLISEALGDNR